jgi:hypothetical protein
MLRLTPWGLTALIPLALGWSSSLTLDIADYATLPITGQLDGAGQTDGLLARVNALRSEPGNDDRFFVVDLNGPLYILDKRSRTWATYLNFNGRDGRKGLFKRLAYAVGYANGLNTIRFDPDYRRNGKFYTVHTEEPSVDAPALPDNAAAPGLRMDGYATTTPIATPGPTQRESVLIEWTDTNTANLTFEGTARELMRVQFNARIHVMGDLTFNPRARQGDADWRVLYIGCGDGGAGESPQPQIRVNPQRLDTLVGKILRIVPDLAAHEATSSVSENGRYRIPHDNPFTSTAGARKEVWALGFRNPHRLSWGTESSDPRLIANSIGLHTWETINIVHRGANYGYPLREGHEMLGTDNATKPRPAIDEIPLQISDTRTGGVIKPTYPVALYPHRDGGGDAIGSGFVYAGSKLPTLRGQYLFTDISTGRVWRVGYAAMVRADDGDPSTMVPLEEVALAWNNPHDTPDEGTRTYPTLFPIARAAYRFRGGLDADLPGRASVSGPGRTDAQFAVDGDGELYVLTKSDGMIRRVESARD